MCHKITRDYMYVNVKKCPSHEMDTFAPRVHFSVPQDYMYVAVKKNLSHELDTFTPRVYFFVAQDYTRLHVCQCQERCLPTHILDVGYILHIIGRIFLNKTDAN